MAYVYNMFGKVRSYFSRDKTVENRTKALLCFAPKWTGFFVNGRGANENIHATDALAKMENVVNSLSYVWIEESGNHRQMKPAHFDIKKVIFYVTESSYYWKLMLSYSKLQTGGSQVFI